MDDVPESRLTRLETLGYDVLSATAPWLLWVGTIVALARTLIDPSWMPEYFGIGGVAAAAIGALAKSHRSKGPPGLGGRRK